MFIFPHLAYKRTFGRLQGTTENGELKTRHGQQGRVENVAPECMLYCLSVSRIKHLNS